LLEGADSVPDHHRPGGGFRNPWGDGIPAGFRSFLKWRLERMRTALPSDPDPSELPSTTPAFDRPRAAHTRLTVTWVGHSTFLLQIGGLNLLTDPVWSERASPVPWAGPKRWVPPGISLNQLPAIDAVVLSHDHYDHLDDATVCRLEARDPGARWFVPIGLGNWLRARGIHEITELDWWGEAAFDSLMIRCAPAQHFSGRWPWGRDRTLWCSWSLSSASHRLYFGGDSGYHPEFAQIAERCGPFDVALMPIGAYEPRWFMRPVHMAPEEAVRAAVDLGGPRLVPMHWGTFKFTDEPMDEPPQRARAAWLAAGQPEERFCQLRFGETLVI
jgi:N-acyl-phosphatidylethanolamine-hydrolysing phospholipase D